MSSTLSPTTPKAKPAVVAAPSTPHARITDTFERMEYYRTGQDPAQRGDRFANARNLTPSRAPGPPPPRSSFVDDARSATDPPPPSVGRTTTGTQLSALAAPSNVRVAPDGSLVRASTGRPGEVPGSYRSPFDHSMVHRAPRLPDGSVQSTRVLFNNAASYTPSMFSPAPAPPPARALAPAPAPAPAPLYPFLLSATPVRLPPSLPTSTLGSQTRAIIPPPYTPQRLVLLGPLRMIRSQCVKKKELLGPIVLWLDRFMGAELQTPAHTDSILPGVVYAVNIPMDDQHWRDWHKVLAVFPRAAAWQEALTFEEPFDRVTAHHGTVPLFRAGEPLELLLADLVQQYNLGVAYEVTHPWNAPGQTEWMAAVAREAHAYY